MALVPVFVSVSVKVLASNAKKEKVSTSFIARFPNGEEKILNKTSWQPIGLRKEEDGSVTPLSKNNCSLYFKDWGNNPTFGIWEVNFPVPLIPIEIASMLSTHSLLGLN